MSFFANLKQTWQETKVRESAKLKNMTFREKARYIFENWSLEIIVAITAVALIVVAIVWSDNATDKYILSVALVDSEMDGKQMDSIKKDFKSYLGDKARKNVVGIEGNLASVGGTVDVVDDYFIYEHQQTSIMLIMSGAMDCYLCPKSYVEFLMDCDGLVSVADALGEETAARYADAVDLDGMALRVDSQTAKDYFNYLPDGEMYLVYTVSIHYPEVVCRFTDFVFSR